MEVSVREEEKQNSVKHTVTSDCWRSCLGSFLRRNSRTSCSPEAERNAVKGTAHRSPLLLIPTRPGHSGS